jgi:hypothetical protein
MKRGLIGLALSSLLLTGALMGTATAQQAGCLPTSARTIGPSGFPGLGVKKVAPVYTDAFKWNLDSGLSSAQAEREAARINALGFVSGTTQLYRGRTRKTRGDQGRGTTVQFGSPEGAQADLAYAVAQIRKYGPWKQFRVRGIPGSRGFRTKDRDGDGASNVYFADGSYFYFVGRYVKRGGSGAGEVIKAARKLYSRVHGAPVCT